MKKIILHIFILLVSIASIGLGQDYIIPKADYNEQAPSPPSIEGEIKNVGSNKITIETKIAKINKHRIVTIKLNAKTKMFTVYGGSVDLKELVPGQRVRIWYTERDPIKKLPIAAAIMIASFNPKDDWP